MNKAYAGVGNPVHEFLGAGALYFNWGLANEVKAGSTKGGNEFNDNAEFREREGDQDFFPQKGHRDIVKMTPTLSINALKLSTANLVRFLAGLKADAATTPGQTVLTRTLDLSASYIENVAFVSASRQGKLMVVLLKNALGDGVLNLPTSVKVEEIVPSIQFVAHADDLFDPDDETTYPYQIIKDTSVVTFTVTDDLAAALPDAIITFDQEYGVTNAGGLAVFAQDKGLGLRYTIEATGFVTATGQIDVDEDTEAVAVQMVAV